MALSPQEFRLKPHWIAFGLVGVLAAWIFAPALDGDSSFAFRDAAHYYHPLFEYIRGEWGRGQLPLWNPYENIGMPLLAENTSSVFYPGKLIFALPLDYTLLYNLYIVLHVLLAAAGGYRLARRFGSSELAAGLAAISYAFGGSVLFQYCNVVFLVGAAWLPWAAVSADRMLRERSYLAAISLGVVLSLMIAGGDPQMAYNAGLLAALYALLLPRRAGQWRAPEGGANPAEPTVQSKQASRPLLLGLTAAVALLVAAVQVLPTIEASAASARGNYTSPRNIYELAAYPFADRDTLAGDVDPNTSWYGGLLGNDPSSHQGQVYQFSIAPWRVIELLWPNITGRPFAGNHRTLAAMRAEDNLWTPSNYLGLLPLVLGVATWSPRRKSQPEIRWLSWMVLLGGLGSLGTYGVAWAVGWIFGGVDLLGVGGEIGGIHWWMVTLLPNYVYFRYSAKLFVVANLGLGVLAARGWDEAWQTSERRVRRWLAVVAVASLVGLIAAIVSRSALVRLGETAATDALLGPFDPAGAWHDILFALGQTALVATSLFALIWLASRRPGHARWAPAAALGLTAIDLAIAQACLVVYAPADAWRFEPPLVKQLPADADNYRVFRQLGTLPLSWEKAKSDSRLAEAVTWDRKTLSPKYPLPYRISLAEASGTMVSRDYRVLLDIARRRTARARSGGLTMAIRASSGTLPDASILDLLAARVAIVAKGAAPPDLTDESAPAEGMVAGIRPTALPRTWIVHRVEVVPERTNRTDRQLKEFTEALLFPDGEPRDWRQQAVVESDLPLVPAAEPPPPGTEESCSITEASASHVRIEARLASAGLVVLSDLYYPGWKLVEEVSGKEIELPILRTNRVMRGAALPAGNHKLVYRYRPASVLWGGAVSGVSTLALLVAGLIAWRRSRLRALRLA